LNHDSWLKVELICLVLIISVGLVVYFLMHQGGDVDHLGGARFAFEDVYASEDETYLYFGNSQLELRLSKRASR